MNKNKIQDIRRHLQAMQQLLNRHFDYFDYLELRKLEKKADLLNLKYCNGDISESEYNLKIAKIEKLVLNLCGNAINESFFINSDCRGYALKLDNSKITCNLTRDWGGYYILAPEF